MNKTPQSAEQIGQNIREYRIKAGLTQMELGEACGYQGRAGEVSIQRWESGRRPVPQDRLRPLSEAISIPLSLLVP